MVILKAKFSSNLLRKNILHDKDFDIPIKKIEAEYSLRHSPKVLLIVLPTD